MRDQYDCESGWPVSSEYGMRGGERDGLLAAVEARVAAAEHPDEEQGYAAAAATAAAAFLGGGAAGATESAPAPQDTGASSAPLASMARLFS